MQNWLVLLKENDEGRGGKRLVYPWVLSFPNTMGRQQGVSKGTAREGPRAGDHWVTTQVHQQLLVQNLPLSPQPLRYKVTFESASVAVGFQVSIQQRLENTCGITQPAQRLVGAASPPKARR